MAEPTFAPRLNHVAITMPPDTLDEASRAELKAFYGDVFGWMEGDNSGESGNPLILMTGQMQFVYLLPGDPALECPHLDHFGLEVSTVDGKRRTRVSIENPGKRFEAWGWNVLEMDGHRIESILATCRQATTLRERPTAIISHSVKGRGVSYMEHDYNWHSKPMTDDDLARALGDIDRGLEGS